MPYSVAAQNARLDALVALYSGGTLQIATDGTWATILATYSLGTLTRTATATITLSGSATAAGGAAAAFRIRNAASVEVFSRSDANAISATGGAGVLVLNQATTTIVAGSTLSFSLVINEQVGP